MLDSIQSLLDAFPEGVVQARNGAVLSANAKARQYLPQLEVGGPLPVSLSPSEETGVFVSQSRAFAYSCKTCQGDDVILFRPDSQSALEDWQLDGVLRQLRSLSGEILAEVGPATVSGGEVPAAAFSKSFHRLFRLVSNLEFMRQASREEGIPFQPVTMDMDGLCSDIVRLAEELLREAGISLTYSFRNRFPGLLIPGDPGLLRRMLLGLISNAARAADQVNVTLRIRGENALLVISNSTRPPSGPQLEGLLQDGFDQRPSQPDQGAGLGLPIAQHIARLHRGKLLSYEGGDASGVLVLLPTGPLNSQLSVHSPSLVQRDGGLNPVLVELSDVLPDWLFGMEGLD